MMVWVLRLKLFAGGGAKQTIVSRHKRQRGQASNSQHVIGRQRACQLYGIVCTKDVLLRQLEAAFDRGPFDRDQMIIVFAVRHKRIQELVSLFVCYLAPTIAACKCTPYFWQCELRNENGMGRVLAEIAYPYTAGFGHVTFDYCAAIQIVDRHGCSYLAAVFNDLLTQRWIETELCQFLARFRTLFGRQVHITLHQLGAHGTQEAGLLEGLDGAVAFGSGIGRSVGHR